MQPPPASVKPEPVPYADVPELEEFPYAESSEDPLPTTPRFSYSAGLPPQLLTIEYCGSCAYKSKVEEFKAQMYHYIPQISIIDEEYPVPALWQLIGTIVGSIRMGLIILLIAGDWVFEKMQVPKPEWYNKMVENKFISGIAIYFVGNYLSAACSNTGAFEISLNGEMLFSKLARGRMPHVQEIVSMIQHKLQAT